MPDLLVFLANILDLLDFLAKISKIFVDFFPRSWKNLQILAILAKNMCPTTKVLVVNQAEFFTAVFLTWTFDLELGICPQQQPPPTSQVAQDVLSQTEMIHQDVRKNAMQTYINYKAYYDKKANPSKLKEADYVYVLLLHRNWGQMGDQGTHSSLLLLHQSPTLLLQKPHQQTGMSSSLLFLLRPNSILRIMIDVANDVLHGGFTYLFTKFLFFFKVCLICLPAMTSVCIFNDTLRNDTEVFLKIRDSIYEICLNFINSNFTCYFLLSSMLSSGAGTSKEIPLNNNEVSLPAIPITLSFSFFQFSCSIKYFIQFSL